MAAIEVPAPDASLLRPIINSPASRERIANAVFTPSEHLRYTPPESVIMMRDLGYADVGISPVAVSQPFRLFSDECIQKFRDEVFSDEVMKNCSRRSMLTPFQLRGHSPKYTPFIHDAWHHPETLKLISSIAGVELIPNINLEVGHVNISVKSEEQSKDELREIAAHGKIAEHDKPVVGWHYDSYPFVCVTMLSDCTNMIGGETVVRSKSGAVTKIRGPEMGCAVVLQGRYITHQALQALGGQERITMVTSFRPKSPFLPDDSILSTIRGISDLSELYYEFGLYRLQIVEERIRAETKRLRDAYSAGKKTDTSALKKFLKTQANFLTHTENELVPDHLVVPGVQPELDIPNVVSNGNAATSIKAKF